MPPPVKLIEIPKKGGGLRPLGIPTIADRIAQSVVRGLLEPTLEPLLIKDSYGYRPGRSAKQAVERVRQLCWQRSWVIDLDIKGFFDNIPHDLLMKAVSRHCETKWILLYIERWLTAPLQLADGRQVSRTKGVPQGSVIGPLLANLYLHYTMDKWLSIAYPQCTLVRYVDDAIIMCRSRDESQTVMKSLEQRLTDCGLEMHASKTKLVYCKDSNRKFYKDYPVITFDFLGFTFMPRQAQNGRKDGSFTNFLPAVSTKAMKAMNEKMRKWNALKKTTNTLSEIAGEINPIIRGWIHYYGTFYKTKMKEFMHILNVKLEAWARRKYKRLRTGGMKTVRWLHQISVRRPKMFAHWELLNSKPTVGKSEPCNGRLLRTVLTESQAVMPGFTY
ncbi:group II intron reverse transcriptase/maturase [Parafilimonas sp.]|uniref:group II intron reverse transcriptase/maturase n=1 Tax=Parafilimonas sp. TaxID=1969739 RepID=UPI0039E358F4